MFAAFGSSIQVLSQWHTVLVLISYLLLCFLPLRAESTFYFVRDYVTFRHLSSSFRKCRIIVPNVPQWAFRTRCCVVLSFIVFRYVSLIFPFLKGKTSGKRSNNDRINDDATMAPHWLQKDSFSVEQRERIDFFRLLIGWGCYFCCLSRWISSSSSSASLTSGSETVWFITFISWYILKLSFAASSAEVRSGFTMLRYVSAKL